MIKEKSQFSGFELQYYYRKKQHLFNFTFFEAQSSEAILSATRLLQYALPGIKDIKVYYVESYEEYKDGPIHETFRDLIIDYTDGKLVKLEIKK